MKSTALKSFDEIQREIDNYETQISKNTLNGKYKGIVYTPGLICDYISKKSLDFFARSNDLKSLRILDPACGTGRFLVSMVSNLFRLLMKAHKNENPIEIKENIVKNNIFGIDLDKKAVDLCKLRLSSWASLDSNSIEKNIVNGDFLIEENLVRNEKFNIILGNPPYIENKKMKSTKNKEILKKKYETAYKLYDISILFIERALRLLKKGGYCSYIITNKFLSADYGIKIRNLLLNQTKILEIIDVSSLKVFKNAAIYPIIISFLKSNPNNNEILIKTANEEKNLNDILNNGGFNQRIDQISLNQIPSKVFPIAGNYEIIKYILNNFKPLSDINLNSKFIYRPFAFTNWAQFLDLTKKTRKSSRDLLLIGTSNIGRYYIKYNNDIKIAKRKLKPSFIPYSENYQGFWRDLEKPKLIFKEVAKNLTAVFDPGKLINITGAYMLTGKNFSQEDLLSLSVFYNSKLANYVFKSLFNSLHMASGYLRFNGSFLKRIPIPEKIPPIFPEVGVILHLLHQDFYQNNSQGSVEIIEFFEELANILVYTTYFTEYFNRCEIQYNCIQELLNKDFSIKHKIDFDASEWSKINKLYSSLSSSKSLSDEFKAIYNCQWVKLIEDF